MDWTKLIRELQGAGWSQQAIADAVGKSQAWVNKMLSTDPFGDVPWRTGERLRKLHRRVTQGGRR